MEKRMKNIFTTPLATLAIAFLAISSTTYASTPDGQTPVNEGVCDNLVGGTPGLYGLCVAFCEAQDHAALSAPITEEEFKALEDSAPSGRILANYNKKKQDSDPDMPCIKAEEPCPCRDSAEFDTATLSMIGAYFCNTSDGVNNIYGSSLQDFIQSTGKQNIVVARNDTISGGRTICSIGITASVPVVRSIDITPEQFTACDTQIRQRQVELQGSGVLGECFQGL